MPDTARKIKWNRRESKKNNSESMISGLQDQVYLKTKYEQMLQWFAKTQPLLSIFWWFRVNTTLHAPISLCTKLPIVH